MSLALSSWLMAILVGLQCMAQVSAHGKLTVPRSRNQIDGNSGCAHCLNTAGPCGDGPSGKFLDYYAGPQAKWVAGSIVAITIQVTAHHMGHYEFRVCDQVLNSSVKDPGACLDKWLLTRATPEEAKVVNCQPGDERAACVPVDPLHPERWYLPPKSEIAAKHTIYFKLPAGLQCEACTLQWHWWSANSCVPASDYGCYKNILKSKGYWKEPEKAAWWTAGSGSCKKGCSSDSSKVYCGCGEQFWNCADISVQPADGSSTGVGTNVATTTTRSMATTPSQTTTEPEPEPEPTTMQPALVCEAREAAKQFGASDQRCTNLCKTEALPEEHFAFWCQGQICDCSEQTTTSTTGESTTQAATTLSASVSSTTTSRTAAVVCKKTPGVAANWVTDARCAKCAKTPEKRICIRIDRKTKKPVCTCSSALFQAGSQAAVVQRHGFLAWGSKHNAGSAFVQRAAVTGQGSALHVEL